MNTAAKILAIVLAAVGVLLVALAALIVPEWLEAVRGMSSNPPVAFAAIRARVLQSDLVTYGGGGLVLLGLAVLIGLRARRV